MPLLRRAARILACVAVIFTGCKGGDPPPLPAHPPPPPPTVKKLEGGPVRVRSIVFAPDGASVLVAERRAPKAQQAQGVGVFAVTRRPVAGGPAKELLASDTIVLDMAPFGDGALVLQRPMSAEEKGEPDEDDDERGRRDDYVDALQKSALYRVSDGAAPVRISPEGRRCDDVLGAANGQWAVYTLAPATGRPRGWLPSGEGEIHVIGTKPGEDVTLAIKSVALGISPDGARVLVRRPLTEAQRKQARPWRDASPRDDAKGLVMVSVKDQAVSDVPQKLQVDGAAIDTSAFTVRIAGDGLSFRSEKGELYRSGLDGSNAVRVAGPFRDTDAGTGTDAGAGTDAGTGTDAGAGTDAGTGKDAKVERRRRVFGPRGTVFELREEAGGVVLSSLAKPGAPESLARFEGPLASLGEVVLDPAEQRVALAVLSDTSRDGSFDRAHDDGEIFITGEKLDPGAAASSFGRTKVALLADEIRPKVAAAAGIPESAVAVEPHLGSVKVTADLPWKDGEDAKALLQRVLVASRAIVAAVPQDDVTMRVRVGQLDLALLNVKDEGPPHLLLAGQGIAITDPEALRLVHRKPESLSSFELSGTTLSGELVNTSNVATPPIEVSSTITTGYDEDRKRVHVEKQLGVLPPGASAKYSLTLNGASYWDHVHAIFKADGKRIAVFNEYAYGRSVAALETALDLLARHGVWTERRHRSYGALTFVMHLTSVQATMADPAREAFFKAVMVSLLDRERRFHQGEPQSSEILFAAPGAGGWKVELGKKGERFETTVDEELARRP